MRIVFVSTRSDVIGGSNVHIRDLAVKARSAGHEVFVLGGGEGPFAADVRRNGLPYVPIRHLDRAIRPLRDAAALLGLRAAFRRLRPDLISLHTAKAGLLGRLAGLGCGVPVLYTPHGWTFTVGVPYLEARLYALIERLAAPLASRIINVCEFEQSIALERGVGGRHRHVVVHNGMPAVDERSLATPDETPPTIVMVARFDVPKDHGTLLRALAGCADLEWRLRLVGDGPLAASVRSSADALGIADRIEFLGARCDVAAQLAQCQIFVLATRWEGFPRSILEAMRAGLPVVASDVGGVREAVIDGETGFVVRSMDVRALGKALRVLVRDASLRNVMGQAGRRAFESQFTFERMAARTFEVYEDVLGEFSAGWYDYRSRVP